MILGLADITGQKSFISKIKLLRNLYLKSQFDYFIYNSFNEEAEQKILNLVRNILDENKE